MAREFAITIYLLVFQFFFRIFKGFSLKRKTLFIASFGNNIKFTLNELKKQSNDPIIILKTDNCTIDFNHDSNITIVDFKYSNPFAWLLSIYHIATSDIIFVDNYFGFLAVTDFKPGVECIQLWHAAGAIKCFGLKDPSIASRTGAARKRFIKVYHRFTKVVVGSDKMARVFQQSFDLSDEVMSRQGIPRSDFFFDHQNMENIAQSIYRQYPVWKKKKVILYAPTFRSHELANVQIMLNLEKMYKTLHHDHVLLLRLHPAVKNKFSNKYTDFIYDVSSEWDINHLLTITDILITDYSSIPFEFSLLERPMIFYSYDLEEYEKTTGFWEDYETLVPGPVVFNTDELIDVLQINHFDIQVIRNFSNQWNQYSKGHSSQQLIESIYNNEKQYQTVE